MFRSKFFVSIFFASFLGFSMYAQPSGQNSKAPSKKITGVVTDGTTNNGLEFATVALYYSEDSSLVTGGITDGQGRFSIFSSQLGSHYLEVEYIGFQKRVISDISITKADNNIDLGTIQMSIGGVNLDAVEVVAERSELQFALDKRVFNVGKDLSSSGGNATDLLDNIPSVTVGIEGEVELRGSSNVRILINGRPSGLLGVGDNEGLRNIQSSMIDRVEVITNPSAKFEAEGMAGIINIILKQNRAKGFNGSFEISGGIPESYGVGANLNYRQDKFNFFVNTNYNKRTGPATGNSYQEFYLDDRTNVSLRRSKRQRNGQSTSIQGGSDYYFSDKEILTASFLYKYGLDKNDNFVEYRDSSFLLTSSNFPRLTMSDFNRYTLRTDDEQEREPTAEFSLDYNKKFSKKGHELKASFSFQDNQETESSILDESLIENETIVSENFFQQKSSNAEGQNQWRTQVDYTQPMDNGVKIEMGAFGNFRTIENDYLVETKVDGVFQREEGLSNNFIYKENVAALYANYGQELKKWSYQAGLRGEWSFISTELVNTNELNERDYPNIFPSLFLGYKFDPTNSLQASYSKRIRRPRFWDLNPFFTLTDRRNFFSGNPNLDPEFSDSYELSHLKFWDSGNIGTSVYYRRTTDVITRILTAKEGSENETVRKPENVGLENTYGIEFVWAYTAIKWLRLDGSLNGFQYDVTGLSDAGETLEVVANGWEGKINAKINFWKGANLQVRLNHNNPGANVQGTRSPNTVVNLGASKDFLNNNLTVTLSVRDLFNDRRRIYRIENESLLDITDFQWRPRTFTATVSYRINKKKSRKRGGYGGEGGGF